jgi:hypothetical protein
MRYGEEVLAGRSGMDTGPPKHRTATDRPKNRTLCHERRVYMARRREFLEDRLT